MQKSIQEEQAHSLFYPMSCEWSAFYILWGNVALWA